ncbi:putative accessory gene regulator protein [Ruminococcus bromii]|nr:accessory gene regulator B family protein [Ruminococcus bromii]PKD28434.1 putative accessory gene regulator protein [Ruminococcus bromii]
MEKFSSKLIEFFVSNDLIKNEDKEIYKYAVNIILSSLIHIATVMIIGLCFNLFIESLVFYFSFIAIRKFAGGYHAKTPVRCYLFSFASNIIILCLVKWLSSINTLFIFIFIIFELLCVVLILLISPLDTENNPLTGQEKKMYRMLTSIITIFIFIISLLCFFKGYRNIGSSMICGVVMSALLLLMRKIQIINMRIKK